MMVDEEYLNLFHALDKLTKLSAKVCTKCKKNKLITEYYERRRVRSDDTIRTYRNSECRTCQRKREQKYNQENPFHSRNIIVKGRATKKQLPFNLTEEYLKSIWTGTCPILGVKLDLLAINRYADNAAQVDRIVPDKGYVKGNVGWISARANRLKSNATAKEHMQIAQWMLGQLNDS